MIKLKELTEILNRQFHKEYALSWDNSGLLIGNFNEEINNILVAVDVNDSVINEAIKLKANLIFSHHPLIFSPIKNIISDNLQGQTILKLAEHKIAVYCAHTNYDLMENGLNDYIAKLLELENIRIIIPESLRWFKFVIFVPVEYEEKVRNAICLAGGGQWKNYSCATFKTLGKGTFKPENGSKPFIGEKGSLSIVEEARIECIVSEDKLNNLINNVLKSHPYEEPAYDIYPLENKFETGGIGRIGNLKKYLFLNDFLSFIKEKLNLNNFKYILKGNFVLKDKEKDKEIRKIAVVNGSVNSIIEDIRYLDFDALVCGEIGYHNAQMISESGKLVIEIGHGESELFAASHIFKILNDINEKMNFNLNIFKSKNNEILWRYLIE
jgi:dinuclear metal center YbgI/SA1388 family protein